MATQREDIIERQGEIIAIENKAKCSHIVVVKERPTFNSPRAIELITPTSIDAKEPIKFRLDRHNAALVNKLALASENLTLSTEKTPYRSGAQKILNLNNPFEQLEPETAKLADFVKNTV